MRYFGIVVITLLILSGCKDDGQGVLGVDEYFQLDSLLDHQIDLLGKSDVQMTKKVILDGEEQEQTFQPDTARLNDEFRIFRELDLNKTNYVGAFEKTVNDSMIRYDLKPDQKSPVKFLEIKLGTEGIDRITGNFHEDKEIYQHEREIEIFFSNNMISGYTIKGFQDMVMRDTVFFQTLVTIK